MTTTTENGPRRTPQRAMTTPVSDGQPGVEANRTADGDAYDTAPGTPADVPVQPDTTTDAYHLSEEQYRGLISWAKKTVKNAAKKAVQGVKAAAVSHVKDIVKTGLPVAGAAVGGFFGGPGGAAIGGKAGGLAGGFIRGLEPTDDRQARAIRALQDDEVEAAQLDEIVGQIIDPTLLVVIDELSRDFAERGSRGGEPVDDEVMERFWGKAVAKIAGAIADELPWAIKKVTQYLDDEASRDVNTIDPLMVDPEVAERFWAPAFSAVLASIQSALPELFQRMTGDARGASPAESHLTWQDLEQARRLLRGDNIVVTELSSINDPETVEIVLELPPHKSWWKAIQVFDASTLIGNVEVEGEEKKGSVRIRAEALKAPDASLLFTNGAGAYYLPASELPELAGQRISFYWYAG